MTEVIPVNCSSEVSFQSIHISLNVTGNIDEVTELDQKSLEEAFVRAYNQAAESSCDSFFRSVVNASISDIGVLVARRQQRRLMQPRLNFNAPFSLFFRVRMLAGSSRLMMTRMFASH